MGRPRIDAVAPLLPDAGDVLLVEDLEDHAEPVLQLFVPLEQHRWRTGHHDVLGLPAKQEFSGDQSGLDCLAEADIISDEEVHPGQAQSLLKTALPPRRFTEVVLNEQPLPVAWRSHGGRE